MLNVTTSYSILQSLIPSPTRIRWPASSWNLKFFGASNNSTIVDPRWNSPNGCPLDIWIFSPCNPRRKESWCRDSIFFHFRWFVVSSWRTTKTRMLEFYNKTLTVRFEAPTVVVYTIQVTWDVTLDWWVSFPMFWRNVGSHSNPDTQHHIPDDLNPQHSCHMWTWCKATKSHVLSH